MAREEKDGIKYAFLDVLTGFFAAALLLMTILAASIGSNGQTSNKSGDGVDYVVSVPFGTEKTQSRPDPEVLTILLAFKGPAKNRVQLELKGMLGGEVSLQQGLFRPEMWSIFRRGDLQKSWSVQFSDQALRPDSVSILVSLGEKALKPLHLAVPTGEPFLTIKEPVKSDESIMIFNQPASKF